MQTLPNRDIRVLECTGTYPKHKTMGQYYCNMLLGIADVNMETVCDPVCKHCDSCKHVLHTLATWNSKLKLDVSLKQVVEGDHDLSIQHVEQLSNVSAQIIDISFVM